MTKRGALVGALVLVFGTALTIPIRYAFDGTLGGETPARLIGAAVATAAILAATAASRSRAVR